MRCPKCKFISFDDLSTCAKCSNDLSALSQDLQGTGTETRVPFFLASVVQAPDFEEETFSESQALPPIDDSTVNLDDTFSGDDSIGLDLDESIEVPTEDVEIELSEVAPIDLSAPVSLEDSSVNLPAFGDDEINFDDDIDLSITDEFDSTEMIDKDGIDLDLTGGFEKSVELDFDEVDLDATGMTLSADDTLAPSADTSDSAGEDLDLDEDLLAELADDTVDEPTAAGDDLSDFDLDEDLTGEFAGIEDSLDSDLGDDSAELSFDDDITGEFAALVDEEGSDAEASSDDKAAAIADDDLDSLLDEDLGELDTSALEELDDDLDATTTLDEGDIDLGSSELDAADAGTVSEELAGDDLDLGDFDGLDSDLDDDLEFGDASASLDEEPVAAASDVDLDDIDVSDLLSSGDSGDSASPAGEDDEVNLSSLMDESADESAAEDDLDLDMLDEDIPEVELVDEDDDEEPPELPPT